MKFRQISDLHVDINKEYPLELKDKDVFTVICGDMAGETEMGIDWIRKNVRHGIIVNGNHMPYRNGGNRSLADRKTMAEFRAWLKNEFPIDGDVSYLDAEIGDFKKEVDGVLFLGSCFYSNFSISEPTWNPTGDIKLNMACSEYNMNDYHYGYVSKTFPAGTDECPSFTRMRADDLLGWFKNAYAKFENELTANEASASPKPVVIITHYPLVSDYLMHNNYVEKPEHIWSRHDFNWASYASDMKNWLKRHWSIRCACSGHIHDVENEYRHYSLKRANGPDLLLMHNVRGYVSYGHDMWFNPDTFVDTDDWTCSEISMTAGEEQDHKAVIEKHLSELLTVGI